MRMEMRNSFTFQLTQSWILLLLLTSACKFNASCFHSFLPLPVPYCARVTYPLVLLAFFSEISLPRPTCLLDLFFHLTNYCRWQCCWWFQPDGLPFFQPPKTISSLPLQPLSHHLVPGAMPHVGSFCWAAPYSPVSALVSHCRVTNNPKMWWLKTTDDCFSCCCELTARVMAVLPGLIHAVTFSLKILKMGGWAQLGQLGLTGSLCSFHP